MTSISASIYNFVVSLLVNSGYAGLFLLMAMESATLPVPSEVILPLAGYYLVFQNGFDFWAVVAVASLGSLVGTLVDYAVGYSLGRAAILRYGRPLHVSEARLARVESWFQRRGDVVVLLARFVPLFRTLVAFPAGVAEMSLPRFVGFSIIGIVAWDAVLVYVGFLAGSNYSSIVSSLQTYFTLVEVLVALVLVLALYLLWRRGTQSKA